MTGAPVAGVSVAATQIDTHTTRSVSTDLEGRYQLPGLGVGAYEVSAIKAGFQTTVRTGVDLVVGQSATTSAFAAVGSPNK